MSQNLKISKLIYKVIVIFFKKEENLKRYRTSDKMELKLVWAFTLQDGVDLKLRVKEIEIGLR